MKFYYLTVIIILSLLMTQCDIASNGDVERQYSLNITSDHLSIDSIYAEVVVEGDTSRYSFSKSNIVIDTLDSLVSYQASIPLSGPQESEVSIAYSLYYKGIEVEKRSKQLAIEADVLSDVSQESQDSLLLAALKEYHAGALKNDSLELPLIDSLFASYMTRDTIVNVVLFYDSYKLVPGGDTTTLIQQIIVVVTTENGGDALALVTQLLPMLNSDSLSVIAASIPNDVLVTTVADTSNADAVDTPSDTTTTPTDTTTTPIDTITTPEDTIVVPKAAVPFALTLATDPLNAGALTYEGALFQDSLVILKAAPIANWKFVGWEKQSGTGTVVLSDSTASTTTARVTGIDIVIKAKFVSLHSVITQANDGNMVVVEPLQALYGMGDVISISPQPLNGWTFSHWTYSARDILTDTLPLIVNGNIAVQGVFKSLHTITINDTVANSILVEPLKAEYIFGDTVHLIPQVDNGWKFIEWNYEATTSPLDTLMFVVNKNYVVSPVFEQLKYLLEVTSTPTPNTVLIDPQSTEYLYGDMVRLTAQIENGWKFLSWSYGDTIVTDEVVDIEVTSDITVEPLYEQLKYSLDIISDITPNTVVIDGLKTEYIYGDSVRLVPQPADGWAFKLWQYGGVEVVENTLDIIIQESVSVEPIFEQIDYSLAIDNELSDAIFEVTYNKVIHWGEEQSIEAVLNSGWTFIGWEKLSGPGSVTFEDASNPSTTFTVTGGDVVLKCIVIHYDNMRFSSASLTTPKGESFRSIDLNYDWGTVVDEVEGMVVLVSKNGINLPIIPVQTNILVPNTYIKDNSKNDVLVAVWDEKNNNTRLTIDNLQWGTTYNVAVYTWKKIGNSYYFSNGTFPKNLSTSQTVHYQHVRVSVQAINDGGESGSVMEIYGSVEMIPYSIGIITPLWYTNKEIPININEVVPGPTMADLIESEYGLRFGWYFEERDSPPFDPHDKIGSGDIDFPFEYILQDRNSYSGKFREEIPVSGDGNIILLIFEAEWEFVD
ncbi:MAG: hypothetical protein OCD01_12910 [Fibrobacterales bacterium]